MWRIELFGEPRVVGYGQVIRRFESKRAVALLAYLAAYPRTRHPREVLIDRIWPDAGIEAGRNRLKQTLASLRRQLEPPGIPQGSVISADRNNVGLVEGAFVCDLTEFLNALRRDDFASAKSLKSGELLPGFYDEWLEDIRAQVDSAEFDLEDVQEGSSAVDKTAPQNALLRLPAISETFFGRVTEQAEVTQLLGNSRWVTICGFGGAGKTTFAIKLATQFAECKAWFVSLASVNDGHAIPGRIANAIHPTANEGTSPFETITAYLDGAETLFLLDNLEQIDAESCRAAIESILEAFPSVRILATSRKPIGSQHERIFSIRTLQVPSSETDLATLSQVESVAMFIDRARRARPDFQLTERNASAVLGLAQRLEGIPLAIELAAAWTHTLSVSEIARRLATDSAILTRRTPGEPRHASLDAVVQSSLSLLPADSKRTLESLCIMQGSWDLVLGEQVAGSSDLIPILSDLIQHAVVQSEFNSEEPRYSILESIRSLVLAQIPDETILEATDRYVSIISTLAVSSDKIDEDPARNIFDQVGWIDYFNSFGHHILAASQLAARIGKPDVAASIILNAHWYWDMFGSGIEYCRFQSWLAPQIVDESLRARTMLQALQFARIHPTLISVPFSAEDIEPLCKAPEDRVEFLLTIAQTYLSAFEDDHGRALVLEARQIVGKINNPYLRARTELSIANTHMFYGDNQLVKEALDTAWRLVENTPDEVLKSSVLYARARLCIVCEQPTEAGATVISLLRSISRLGMVRASGRTLNLMCCVHRDLKKEALARIFGFYSLVNYGASKSWRGATFPIWNIGLSFQTEGRSRDALFMFERGKMLWEATTGRPLYADDGPQYEAVLDECRAIMDPLDIAALQSHVREVSHEQYLIELKNIIQDDFKNSPTDFGFQSWSDMDFYKVLN